MKLACDQIASKAMDALEAAGHEIVYCAGQDPDEWWVAEAVKRGAECLISHDWDVVLMADERGLKRVKMPDGIAGVKQAEFVLKELAR